MSADIVQFFRNHDLVIKKKALPYVIGYIEDIPDQEGALQKIVSEILSLNRTENDVSVEVIQSVIENIQKQESNSQRIYEFQSAFECPKFVFDSHSKMLTKAKESPHYIGTGQSKVIFQKERFENLKRSLLHTKLFSKSMLKFKVENEESLSLTNIIELNQKPLDDTVIVIGIIDIDGGTYTLEDETGVTNLSVGKDTKYGDGMFPIGCIVIVQGTAQGSYINALVIGHPPPLLYPDFINVFWNLKEDPYGWGLTKEEMSYLHSQLMEVHQGSLILTFSDVWIDVPSVVDQFNYVLSTYDKSPPNMIILCGSFTSKIIPFNRIKEFVRLFKKFVDVIKVHSEIFNNTQFVFVPSPTDPAAPKVFPRPALPLLIQKNMEEVFPTAIFMTNPCRIRFLDQTITVFRDDLMSRLSRCSLIPISDSDEHESLLMTVLRQCHLTPTDVNHTTVSWEFDHAMRLFPAPNLLILADSSAPWSSEQDGTKAFNPGCFGNGASFCAYFPARGEISIRTI